MGRSGNRTSEAAQANLNSTLTAEPFPEAPPSAPEPAVAHDEAAPTAPQLPSRYLDLGPIASGGFGEVRRVLDRHLERTVAMKLLHSDIAEALHLQVRFLAEVKLTAGLEHPGIVPVYDWGQLADGRLWFTMREVRGQTLRKLIAELHAAADDGGFRETPSGWTFRRLVDAFARLCQAVAFAHRRGIVHRDLKPDNVMVGELGEVMVMDWGLGRRLLEPDRPLSDLPDRADESASSAPPASQRSGADSNLTQHGEILGTPAYMPPEQALGDNHLHGLPSDVYALGAILYHLLSGHKPYEGGKRDVLLRVRLGAPTPVAERARVRGVPVELIGVCERAMQREIGDRYPDAEALARDVLAWLDGVRRREQALAALARAGSARDEIAALRAEAARAQADARERLATARPFDPVSRKLPGWQREDEAAHAARTAALRETSWLEKVHGALSLDPDLPEAHALLADHYRERLLDAELGHHDEDAARFEILLRAHDRGRHAAFLRGDGHLSLVTDPPGAHVSLEAYVVRGRRLVTEPRGELGPTPLAPLALGRGSYL
ncbi:MAG: serine/threonine protein kinase, partial [Myxococcales bacterium]